jgi:hypothetical protein
MSNPAALLLGKGQPPATCSAQWFCGRSCFSFFGLCLLAPSLPIYFSQQ